MSETDLTSVPVFQTAASSSSMSVTTRRFIEARRIVEEIRFAIQELSLPMVRLQFPFSDSATALFRDLKRFSSSSPPEEWIFLLPNEFWDSEFGFWHFPLSSPGWKGVELMLTELARSFSVAIPETAKFAPTVSLNERQFLILNNSKCLVVSPPTESEVMSMLDAILLEVETSVEIRDQLSSTINYLEKRVIPEIASKIPPISTSLKENLLEQFNRLSRYYTDVSIYLHQSITKDLQKPIHPSLIVDHTKRLLRDKTPDEWVSTDLKLVLTVLNFLPEARRVLEIRKMSSLIVAAGIVATASLNNEIGARSDIALLVACHQRFAWATLGDARIKWALSRTFLQYYFADERIKHQGFRSGWKNFVRDGEKVRREIKNPEISKN